MLLARRCCGGGGPVCTHGPLRTVAIPETLQDALMARLDSSRGRKRWRSWRGARREFLMTAPAIARRTKTPTAGLAQLVAAELLISGTARREPDIF